jgi:hypothetical protein
MITASQLADGFSLNTRLILLQTQDVSHVESLTQTPYNINSLNWVVGHIAVNRDRVLLLIGEKPLLTESETTRYHTGSEPVREDSENIVPLAHLLEVLNQGQELISKLMPTLPTEELDRKIQIDDHETTVGARLFGLYFHDTYHTGQTDLLRQVSGKNDHLI